MTKFMYILFCILIFSLLYVPKSMALSDIEKINQSLNYLRENTLPHPDRKEIDIPKSEQVINELSVLVTQVKLTEPSQVLVSKIRAQSLQIINTKRLINKQAVDVAQSERALADKNFIISKSSGNDLSRALYEAGHISLHLLQHSVKAYDYWYKCAEKGYPPCMNIMAQGLYTGAGGLTTNIANSLIWHNKVFQSGKRFTCAGVFSANAIRRAVYLFPEMTELSDWRTWLTKRDELAAKVDKAVNKSDACIRPSNYALDYVFDTQMGIDKALSLSDDDAQKRVFEMLKQDSMTDEVMMHLDSIEKSSSKCQTSFVALLYAKYYQSSVNVGALENYFTSLDQSLCEIEFATMNHLQSAGKWEKIQPSSLNL